MNQVILVGNIGKDANVQTTPTGITVAKFSVATERSFKNRDGEWQKQTDWHNVVVWRCEKYAERLVKGSRLLVVGRLETRSYEKDGEKKYVTEVVAERVNVFGGSGAETGVGHGGADSDIPF